MRRTLAAGLLVLAGACAPVKSRVFELGLIGPVSPGVAAAARLAGLTVREAAPEGAVTVDAGVVIDGPLGRSGERMADWSRLRLLVGAAAASGRSGVFFTLPKATGGRELTSYPEEWQALSRVARETSAIRPILESGIETDVPVPLPDAIAARAWRYQGRLYVLLVNAEPIAVPIPQDELKPWRALFEVRADPRDLLAPCGADRCLPAERVLWLEGRL